jgi:hypothetical protein
MNSFKKYSQIFLTVAILAAGASVSYTIVAHAQTTNATSSPQAAATGTLVSPADLQYPIAALGNCGSVSDCRDYCNVSANQTACLNFAAQHNLMTQAAIARAQQLLALIQNGQTPGNCSTAQECRTYCSDTAHADECLNFAEQAGFVSAAQVNAIRQNNGKGPGGCASEQSCAAFCNNSANQSVCLDFARQNGLISQVQAQNIQQSATGLRIGLQQFPGQVVSCLKGELGDSAVGELESGNITPNASTSAVVNGCLSAYKSQIQNRFQNLIQSASSTVQNCLQGIASSTVSDLTQGNFGTISGDEGEKVRECLSEMNSQNGEDNQGSSTQNQERNIEQEMNQARNQVQNQLDNLPDRVKNCVQPYIDLNPTSTNIGAIISQCMRAYGASTNAGEGEGRGVMQGFASSGAILPQGPGPMIRGGDGNGNQGGDN